MAIALDGFFQALTHFGIIGVTLSSRVGTAAAHGHRYAKVTWWLLDRVWPFGCDAGGTPHCVSAIEHDIARAKQVIAYLTGDPIVNEFCAKHRVKPTYKEL